MPNEWALHSHAAAGRRARREVAGKFDFKIGNHSTNECVVCERRLVWRSSEPGTASEVACDGPHFLVTCWPFVGHLYPQISVAHALRDRGHEVAFYSHKSASTVLEAEGFQLFPFVHVDERRYERIHALEAKVPATQPKYQTLSVAMTAYRDMLADSIPEQVADLQPIIREWRPDVLITDPALMGTYSCHLGTDGRTRGAADADDRVDDSRARRAALGTGAAAPEKFPDKAAVACCANSGRCCGWRNAQAVESDQETVRPRSDGGLGECSYRTPSFVLDPECAGTRL